MLQFTLPRPKLDPYFDDIFRVDRTELSPFRLRLDVSYRMQVLGTEEITATACEADVVFDEIRSLIGRVRRENPWLPPPCYETLSKEDKKQAHRLLRELETQCRKSVQFDLFEASLSDEAYQACAEAVTDASDAIREKDPIRLRTILTNIAELTGNSGVEIERVAQALVAVADRIILERTASITAGMQVDVPTSAE